eukprot:Gb_08553 [translate_table: standard]
MTKWLSGDVMRGKVNASSLLSWCDLWSKKLEIERPPELFVIASRDGSTGEDRSIEREEGCNNVHIGKMGSISPVQRDVERHRSGPPRFGHCFHLMEKVSLCATCPSVTKQQKGEVNDEVSGDL